MGASTSAEETISPTQNEKSLHEHYLVAFSESDGPAAAREAEQLLVKGLHRQFSEVPVPPHPGAPSTWPSTFSPATLPRGLSPYMDGTHATRRSHRQGVGATGFFQMLPRLPDSVPENDFFRPGKTLPVTVRHSNMSLQDDAGMDIRGMGVKFCMPEDERSPLDLVLSTGARSPWWSAASMRDWVSAHLGGIDAMKAFLRANPYSFQAHTDCLKRSPHSYTTLHYYSHSTYELVGLDQRVHHCRFRVVPAGEWSGAYNSDTLPDEPLPAPDKNCPWHVGRLKGHRTAQLERGYLKAEFRKRMLIRPVLYWLQIQVFEDAETLEEGGVQLNSTVGSPAYSRSGGGVEEAPWASLGEIIVYEPLDEETVDNLCFSVGHHPPCLRLPPTGSAHDYNSTLTLRDHLFPPKSPSARLPQYDGRSGGLMRYLVRFSVGECKGTKENAAVHVTLMGQKGGRECVTKPLRLTHWADNTLRQLSIDEWLVCTPHDLTEISLISIKLEPLGQYTRWFVKRVEVIAQDKELPWVPGVRTVVTDAATLQQVFTAINRPWKDDYAARAGHEAQVIEVGEPVAANPSDRPIVAARVVFDDGATCWFPVQALTVVLLDCTNPEEPLGLVWDNTRLAAVEEGSAAERCYLAAFVGRRVLQINGIEVASESEIQELLCTGTAFAFSFDLEDGPMVFPAYRWLDRGEVVLFEASHMLLHKEVDPNARAVRNLMLDQRRSMYSWEPSPLHPALPAGLPADLHALPAGEKTRLDLDLDMSKLFVRKAKDLLLRPMIEEASQQRFPSLEAFDEVFFSVKSLGQTPLPMREYMWRDDAEFARHFVEGAVCSRLELFRDDIPRLAIRSSHLAPMVPPDLSALSHTDIIDELRRREMLYMADLSVLAGLPCQRGRYLVSPVVVFMVVDGRLRPAAIQLTVEDAAGPFVFTPSNCGEEDWLGAKVCAMCAAAHVQFFGDRVLNLYLAMEPIIVAVNRNLPDTHPVYKLLQPHTKRSLAAICQVKEYLLGPKGIATSLFSLTPEGQAELLRRLFASWRLDTTCNFPCMMQERGLERLARYSYRDAACHLWDVIESYVVNMIQRMYPHDDDVAMDVEFTTMLSDLLAAYQRRKLSDIIGGTPVLDRKGLVDFLTSFIWNVSVQQAALTNSLWDTFASVPFAPFALYAPPPLHPPGRPGWVLDILPSKSQSARQVVLVWMLAAFSFVSVEVAYQRCDVLGLPQEVGGSLLPLGYWSEDLLVHDELRQIVHMLQVDLEDAGRLVEESNAGSPYPYIYLTTHSIPNSLTPPVRRHLDD